MNVSRRLELRSCITWDSIFLRSEWRKFQWNSPVRVVFRNSNQLSFLTNPPAVLFLELHQLIMQRSDELRKEELFYILFSRLFGNYAHTSLRSFPLRSTQIKKACEYLESHASETIILDDICQRVSVSKSSLIRSFSKQLGLTPHSYLMSIRVKEAQTFLKQGIPPSLAALKSGFADQAHFSNVFNRLTGLTPSSYQNVFLKKAPSSNDSN